MLSILIKDRKETVTISKTEEPKYLMGIEPITVATLLTLSNKAPLLALQTVTIGSFTIQEFSQNVQKEQAQITASQ